jgi:hypothetical protein
MPVHITSRFVSENFLADFCEILYVRIYQTNLMLIHVRPLQPVLYRKSRSSLSLSLYIYIYIYKVHLIQDVCVT